MPGFFLFVLKECQKHYLKINMVHLLVCESTSLVPGYKLKADVLKLI